MRKFKRTVRTNQLSQRCPPSPPLTQSDTLQHGTSCNLVDIDVVSLYAEVQSGRQVHNNLAETTDFLPVKPFTQPQNLALGRVYNVYYIELATRRNVSLDRVASLIRTLWGH
jgi:hypothetical protein